MYKIDKVKKNWFYEGAVYLFETVKPFYFFLNHCSLFYWSYDDTAPMNFFNVRGKLVQPDAMEILPIQFFFLSFCLLVSVRVSILSFSKFSRITIMDSSKTPFSEINNKIWGCVTLKVKLGTPTFFSIIRYSVLTKSKRE